jgi:hypothetical protein
VPRARGRDITDDAFVKCRIYRHAWDEFYPIDMERPWYGWRLSLRCMRCQTERHDTMDFKGQLMGRFYLYPDGYQTKGEDRPTLQVFREDLFTRLRDELEAHEQIAVNGNVTPIKKAARKAS